MSQSRSDPPRDLSLHPALGLLVAVLGIAAMRLVVPIFARDLPLRLLFVISEMTLALPAVLALLWTNRPLARTLALRAIDGRSALLAAGLGLALWLASLGLLELQYTVWPPPPGYLESFRRIHEALRPANAFDAAVSVLTIAAAPAIFEEIVVRGVVLPSCQRPERALPGRQDDTPHHDLLENGGGGGDGPAPPAASQGALTSWRSAYN